ncbi:MAG: hypothetical protein Q9187_003594 [Circinaria calcarea]
MLTKPEQEYFESISGKNIDSVLVNPFLGKCHVDMVQFVNEFMEETGIDSSYHEVITKGAFLAQDHHAFASPRDDGLRLDPGERMAMNREANDKWNQPFTLYALIACCSLGAAVQGWDEIAANGAQIFYKFAIGIENRPGLEGLVSAAPYLCCAVLGCWSG